MAVDESESSDSEKETEQGHSKNETKKTKLPNPMLDSKLPAPSLGNVRSVSENAEGSVFTNKFENAEMAKKSLLEKHVKMTEGQFRTGKKARVCKKFKQGRCFYGTSCQYSHDIDANLSLRYKKDEPVASEHVPTNSQEVLKRHNNPHAPQLPPPPVAQGFLGTLNTLHTASTPKYSQKQQYQFRQQETFMSNADAGDEDDDKFNVGDKRKKRVGVSQTLVPPKKAMSALTKQRQEERPWTVQKP